MKNIKIYIDDMKTYININIYIYIYSKYVNDIKVCINKKKYIFSYEPLGVQLRGD